MSQTSRPRVLRIISFAMCLVVCLAFARRARAEGEDIGHSWTDCTVEPPVDADQDGLDDSCEYLLAKAFAPVLVTGTLEDSAARRSYWAVRRDPHGRVGVRIFYALSYFRDTGESVIGSGFLGHFGDSEFIALDIAWQQGSTWVLTQAYLSAHFATSNDVSSWHQASDLEYQDEVNGAPQLYVSLFKHANYASAAGCKALPQTFDKCPSFQDCIVVPPSFPDDPGLTDPFCTPAGTPEETEVLYERNLGTLSSRLVDREDADANGNSCSGNSSVCRSEWYWSNVRFCGWQEDAAFDRSTTWLLGGCAPESNAYYLEMADLEMMATAPLLPSSLCDAFENCTCPDTGKATCQSLQQLLPYYRQKMGDSTLEDTCGFLLQDFSCADGGHDASAGSNCNGIQNTAPVIERVVTAGSPPSLPAAGDIAPGTYYMTSSTAYGTQGVGGCIADTLQATLVLVPTTPSPPILYGDFELATKSRINGELHASLTYATNGSLFAFALLCPAVATGSYLYTATPTEFRLEATTSDCAIVDVFTKQSDATDIGKADAGKPMLDASTDTAKDAAAPIPCTSLADCTGGFVCKASTCTGSGTCAMNACIVYAGEAMCGCDGKTYDSSCSAYAAGNLAYTTAACPRDAGN